MPEANDKLRRARVSRLSPSGSGRRMSRQELADLINAELAARGVRHAPLDDTYIGKLERGQHRWPQEAYRAAFRAVFGATVDAQLGFFVVRRQGPHLEPINAGEPPSGLSLVGVGVDYGAYRQVATPME